MFNFYLITFNLKYFPGNIYQNSMCFAVSDLIAYLISSSILERTNTSQTLIISFCICLVGGILYIVFQ